MTTIPTMDLGMGLGAAGRGGRGNNGRLATLILHDVALSLARLWWFVAWSDGELGASYLAAANVAGVLEAVPRWRGALSTRSRTLEQVVSPASAIARCVAIGWAMASWTRASLTLQGRLAVTTRRHSSPDEARAIACAELLAAWLLLRVAGRLLGARFAPKLWHGPVLLVGLLGLDELGHHLLIRVLLGPPSRPFSVCGRPIPPESDAKDEDCCICLGSSLFEDEEEGEDDAKAGIAELPAGASPAGASPAAAETPAPQRADEPMNGTRTAWDLGSDSEGDDESVDFEDSVSDIVEDSSAASASSTSTTVPPSTGSLASASASTSADTSTGRTSPMPRSSSAALLSALATFPTPPEPVATTPKKDPLECFCRHPQHIAHRRCMARWLSSSNSGSIFSRRRGSRMVRGRCPMCRQPLLVHLEPIPGKSVGWGWEWDWSAMAARGVVSVACIGGVSIAVLAQGYFRGWRSRPKKVAHA
jgi:hypothetical protein